MPDAAPEPPEAAPPRRMPIAQIRDVLYTGRPELRLLAEAVKGPQSFANWFQEFSKHPPLRQHPVSGLVVREIEGFTTLGFETVSTAPMDLEALEERRAIQAEADPL